MQRHMLTLHLTKGHRLPAPPPINHRAYAGATGAAAATGGATASSPSSSSSGGAASAVVVVGGGVGDPLGVASAATSGGRKRERSLSPSMAPRVETPPLAEEVVVGTTSLVDAADVVVGGVVDAGIDAGVDSPPHATTSTTTTRYAGGVVFHRAIGGVVGVGVSVGGAEGGDSRDRGHLSPPPSRRMRLTAAAPNGDDDDDEGEGEDDAEGMQVMDLRVGAVEA